MISLFLLQLLVTPAVSDHPKPSTPTCYAPDGQTIANSSFAACNRLGITQADVHSSCCQLNLDDGSADLCAITGLCLNNGIVRRGFCTDPSWKSPVCVKVCDNPEAGGSPNSFAEMTSCTDGTYCCGRNNLTCCGTSWAVKPPMLMLAAADSANQQKKNNDQFVIVGLGAGLGGVVVVSAGLIGYLLRKIWILQSDVKRVSRQIPLGRTNTGEMPLLVSSFERGTPAGGILSPRAMYSSQEPWGPDSYSLKYNIKGGGDGHAQELDSAALSEAGLPEERRTFIKPTPWDERRYTG
ncbi:hypothetical protein QBC38DRAFT_445021 [Podospora fimiseda]|uniref:Mid2 domain-containing protein n=1 Tax=Podospora fimiseda TaxID=252190 RepID=A0AAN7H0D5_9PEZI|nr:hypothetical protein QBC38DRAFT_445021 [Podospora fimiseda]